MRDELVQGKIKNRHEAKETQQKNDLPDWINQISDGMPGRDVFSSRPGNGEIVSVHRRGCRARVDHPYTLARSWDSAR